MYAYLSSFYFLITVYLFLWKQFIQTFGPIWFVYYLDANGCITNITLQYYTGIGLDKYRKGNYFCQIVGPEQSDYFTYRGQIEKLSVKKDSMAKEPVRLRRKNVMMFHHGVPIQFDLNLLDNYARNMYDQQDSKDSLNLSLVCRCFGINCSEVHFITLVPFQKIVKQTDQIDLYELYEDLNKN